MSHMRFHTSRPDSWTAPRPFSDATMRRRKHGPILPLEQPSLLERLLGG
ncbi:MAG: hypothetical protein V2J51_00945 [Erythrobacter sp.]|nr:hypothetical protein [Erythrobacter sp.]